MAGSNSHIRILTLNINELNAPIKRYKLANWIKNQNPLVCCIQETHLTGKDTQRLKIKGWRKQELQNSSLIKYILKQHISKETKKVITEW